MEEEEKEEGKQEMSNEEGEETEEKQEMSIKVEETEEKQEMSTKEEEEEKQELSEEEEEMKKLPFDRRKELEHEFAIVQEQQISFARDPLVPSISSIAVPIFNFKKKLLGVLTVVGFSRTIPVKIEDPISQYLLKVGQELSEGFGYVQKSESLI